MYCSVYEVVFTRRRFQSKTKTFVFVLLAVRLHVNNKNAQGNQRLESGDQSGNFEYGAKNAGVNSENAYLSVYAEAIVMVIVALVKWILESSLP